LGDLEIGKFIENMGLDQSIKDDIFHKAAMEWLDISKERFN
jgi:aminocarboxymuconate-semialdehyde decarboxylase